ncbi:Protein of unknown function [Pyronema omphalodes CBS 100304]|uniref:Uncharacterized protein n=1 Tax=Pyronema omphalodes (strain CBS 100304) TaxID=1076935 RepID=U4L855_PYROM|nr:Protein of unknown function [Pyronema omphalodes CBS 100304]
MSAPNNNDNNDHNDNPNLVTTFSHSTPYVSQKKERVAPYEESITTLDDAPGNLPPKAHSQGTMNHAPPSSSHSSKDENKTRKHDEAATVRSMTRSGSIGGLGNAGHEDQSRTTEQTRRAQGYGGERSGRESSDLVGA